MTERLAVKALSHGSGVFVFLPFDNTMAEFMDLKYFAHVCARGEGDYKYWVFGYNST